MSDSLWLHVITHPVPLSMGFPRQEYWNELPFPFPGNLPNPGIKLMSPALADGFFTVEPTGKPKCVVGMSKCAVKYWYVIAHKWIWIYSIKSFSKSQLKCFFMSWIVVQQNGMQIPNICLVCSLFMFSSFASSFYSGM